MFETHLEVAKKVAEGASQFDFVEAVAVAGSIRNGMGTDTSDVDISINHRIAAMLASYFDILFAINKMLHIGEKRLMDFALRFEKKPENMLDNLNDLVQYSDKEKLIQALDDLIENLKSLLKSEGLL